MKITLILMISFLDGTATLHSEFLVPGGADQCLRWARNMMIDRPMPTFADHAVRTWSATCVAENIGRPS